MKENKWQNLIRNFLGVLLILIIISILFAELAGPLNQTKEVSLSQMVESINRGDVKKLEIQGNEVKITYSDSSQAKSTKEIDTSLSQSLINLGADKEKIIKVEITTKEDRGLLFWLSPISLFLFPLIFLGLFLWLIFRQAKSGAMQAFNFGRAGARLFGAEDHRKEKITFKNVAGQEEAKEELKEVIDFLKNPQKFLKIGARIPRGVLLMGPAGVGKTLLARAVAGEANVPFLSISGSEFVEMFVGVGAARVRDLFATAKKAAPAIIFIDELDAVGRHRGAGLGGGHDEREQTLNQILVEMDGFERNTNVIVMSATNRPDILDPALLRPGRFDRKVILDLPDVNGREEVLKIHSENKPLASDANIREIAERTPGFSGADLANLMNEAAILAARRNKEKVHQQELLEAIEKVLLGPERRSHILSKKEKEIAAYHEAGHALVATSLPYTEPVRKISIVSRGPAAGYTLQLPSGDKYMRSRKEFISELAILLGGWSAEKVIFRDITTGAANDLEKASELARRLIKEYGMSEKMGPVVFGERDELIFLGKELGEQRNYSEATAREIDAEVTDLIENAQKTAEKVIRGRRTILTKIARVLIEKETIERDDFEKLIRLAKLAKKHA